MTIHGSAKKRGYSERQIMEAWRSGADRRCWLDGRAAPRELRIGFDSSGTEYEIVGLVFTDGHVLIHHCLTPPTKESRRLTERARRRMR